MRTSAEQVPSLHKVASRYLQLVTSSNYWPFMLIYTLDNPRLPYQAHKMLCTLNENGKMNWVTAGR